MRQFQKCIDIEETAQRKKSKSSRENIRMVERIILKDKGISVCSDPKDILLEATDQRNKIKIKYGRQAEQAEK